MFSQKTTFWQSKNVKNVICLLGNFISAVFWAVLLYKIVVGTKIIIVIIY